MFGVVAVSILVGTPVLLTVVRKLCEYGSTKSVSQDLHRLRDESTKRFTEQLVRCLRRQARRGRSDYEFHFRKYDIWLEWITIFGVLSFPYFTSYWDCIESEGSRKVVEDMLQGRDKQFYVNWSVHSRFPQLGAPKWVLSVRWEPASMNKLHPSW
eukprot:TRINITY_DN6504_c0_g1_i1.p1 TRINITY_DN6504_c0_g1~~TRINITY_DN6504_c0_g1_i1.p1  ORF type:complete len:165 (-),score=11.70 TRINITY_DN6504_c0_g1_i1:13-477(-)